MLNYKLKTKDWKKLTAYKSTIVNTTAWAETDKKWADILLSLLILKQEIVGPFLKPTAAAHTETRSLRYPTAI